jgi:hypothetical protein
MRVHTPHHHSLGRKLLSALGLAATNAAETAQIWPPRDPVGPVNPACYGENCGRRNMWDNYGYTQAVPAEQAGVGVAGGNNFYTPDGFMRPVPLAAPTAFGRRR